MNRIIKLHNNVTEKMLLDNGFTKIGNNRFSIKKVIYKPLLVLRMDIDLNDKVVSYDVIDRNTQNTYFHFWNNVNEENNLVALEVIRNFDKYVEELQERRILKRTKRNTKNRRKANEN